MKAHELLADRKNWTQGALARNEDGDPIFSNDKDAVCWCALGAINKCYEDNVPIIRKLKNRLFSQAITKFNDTHTHEEVVSLLKELDI